MKTMDLTGKQFGRLVVIGLATDSRKGVFWKCKCSCGVEKNIASSHLKSGRTISCGCAKKERLKSMARPSKIENLVGMTFGRLTVIENIGFYSSPSGFTRIPKWRCKCTCGNSKVEALSNHLKSGDKKSCGCLVKNGTRPSPPNKTHGESRENIYLRWQGMLNRCRNVNTINYKYYGGKGVSVCDRWLSFDNFINDMGMPLPGYSLDRINPHGNYEPNNCRWSTIEEQSNNKRKQYDRKI